MECNKFASYSISAYWISDPIGTNPPIPKCAPYPTATGPCTGLGNSIRNPYPAPFAAGFPSPASLRRRKACHGTSRPFSFVPPTGSAITGSGNLSSCSSLRRSCSGLPICKPCASRLGTPARVALGWRVGMKGVRETQVLLSASRGLWPLEV